MDDPNDLAGESDADASSVAMAAAEAAAAAAAEGEDPSLCRICGKGDDGRALVRFLPAELDLAAAHAAPTTMTFSEDITLHVFCGKTASILPSVNLPEYEILSKAGIKNKHGIGPEVNGALARTRCALISTEGAKEKSFYLVKEFEAHLAAMRNNHVHAHHNPHHDLHHGHDPHHNAHQQVYHHIPQDMLQHHQGLDHHQPDHHHPDQPHHIYASLAPDHHNQQHQLMPSHHESHAKLSPVRAAAGAIHKPGRRKDDVWSFGPPDESAMTSDGKIRCACGGTHLPTGTPKGAASWRSHVMTKRHQKWMEENGLLGAV